MSTLPATTSRVLHPRLHPLAVYMIAAFASGASVQSPEAYAAGLPLPSIRSFVAGNSLFALPMRALLVASTPGGGTGHIPTTIPVLNCNDAGPGTLRDAAAAALDGDHIDLSQLTCPESKISLADGAIVIGSPATSVTLDGPTPTALTIDGNNGGRVLEHLGSGTMTVNNLIITRGSYSAHPSNYGGGCIYESGSLTLNQSTVSNCTLSDSGQFANGAGVYAKGNLTLNNSIISGCRTAGKGNSGGGAFAKGNVAISTSSIVGNIMYGEGSSGSGSGGTFGGLYSGGTMQIYGSTIAENRAYRIAGAGSIHAMTISNSTISGNVAFFSRAGISSVGPLTLNNSTIASNLQDTTEAAAGAGVYAASSVQMSSSIIASNNPLQSGTNYDFSCFCTVTGSNNLITSHSLLATIPADSVTVDPMLLGLADNGGPTQTMALKAGSPAINAGINVQNFPFDQRGMGFPRAANNQTDIGAFEFSGEIFANGFEGF